MNYSLRKMQSQEKADCSVLALASAGALFYHEAHALLKSVGRKPRTRVPGKIFLELGLTQRPELCCKTVNSAMQEMKNGRFVVFVANHFFGVVDGCAYDNQFTNPKCRVRMVYEIPLDDAKLLEKFPNLAHLVALDKLPDMRGINERRLA